MKYGGEDTVACVMARVKDWKTWSFPDLVVVHNKPIGMGHASNFVKIRFRQGWGEWFAGSHPLFFFLKSLRRCVKEPPFLVGGLMRMAGFIAGMLSRERRQLSSELIHFMRKEQWQRIVRWNSIATDVPVEAGSK